MTLRIHIGAHKTATTELQRALRKMRDRLAEGGVGFYGPPGLRSERIQLHLAMHGDDPAARRKASRRLGRWLQQHETCVMSEENIAGSIFRRGMFGPGNILYPQAESSIASLRDLLGGRDFELFLSIRDPAGFVTSAYGQLLRQSHPTDIETYVKGYDVASLSWAGLAERLTACPGVTRLTCWRYEDYAALRPRILTALIGADLAAEVPAPEHHNSGISDAAYRQFVEWVMADREEPFAELLQRARAAHPKGPGVSGMRPLPAEVYERSRAFYAGDVRRLSALPGVTFIAPQSPANGTIADKPA